MLKAVHRISSNSISGRIEDSESLSLVWSLNLRRVMIHDPVVVPDLWRSAFEPGCQLNQRTLCRKAFFSL
jgi:hypothetical protein